MDSALEKNPYDATLLYQLGLTHYAAGKYKKCIKTMKLALRNKPFISFETDIYYHIGLAYCKV
jgi:tetratricopeptide (TPR) repeat protein